MLQYFPMIEPVLGKYMAEYAEGHVSSLQSAKFEWVADLRDFPMRVIFGTQNSATFENLLNFTHLYIPISSHYAISSASNIDIFTCKIQSQKIKQRDY